MKEMGAPQELIDEVVAKDSGIPEIQPANAITVSLFFAVTTQWNYAGMSGVRTGLNYAAVDVRASKMPEYQALSPEDRGWVWDGLQRMEAAAIRVWSSET